jgi:hypothetical protein
LKLKISDLEELSNKQLNTNLIYFFGLIITQQTPLYEEKKNVMILPDNYQTVRQDKHWNIPDEVHFLMIPIREDGCNGVLMFINPRSAYLDKPSKTVHSCMILVYTGISLSPSIIHICNQYNAR